MIAHSCDLQNTAAILNCGRGCQCSEEKVGEVFSSVELHYSAHS